MFRGEVTKIFDEIHQQQKIEYIHSHIEVGNMATYRRDKRKKNGADSKGYYGRNIRYMKWYDQIAIAIIGQKSGMKKWNKPCFESPMRQK